MLLYLYIYTHTHTHTHTHISIYIYFKKQARPRYCETCAQCCVQRWQAVYTLLCKPKSLAGGNLVICSLSVLAVAWLETVWSTSSECTRLPVFGWSTALHILQPHHCTQLSECIAALCSVRGGQTKQKKRGKRVLDEVSFIIYM